MTLSSALRFSNVLLPVVAIGTIRHKRSVGVECLFRRRMAQAFCTISTGTPARR
jgi:hypothetical protein